MKPLAKLLSILAVAIGLTANADVDLIDDGREINLSSIGGSVKRLDIMDATLKGTLDHPVKIIIHDGGTVTLNGVKINPNGEYGSDPYYGISCFGNATIVLKGDNLVRSFGPKYSCIHVPERRITDNTKFSTLTIKEGEGGGSLEVVPTDLSFAAGIGGDSELAVGNIVIESGTIRATGGLGGAGIGAGPGNGRCQNITILGGKVIATGGNGAAGIGAGMTCENKYGTMQYPHCGNITISGGEIEATGGMHAAGIGGGLESGCKNINISYATKVTATHGAKPFAEDAVLEAIGRGCDCPWFDGLTIGGSLQDLQSDNPATRILAIPGTINLAEVTQDTVIEDCSRITGTLAAAHKITIADGATVVLDNITINDENASGESAGITCEGDANIVLRGSNRVTSFSTNKPGIFVPKSKTLTINGPGSLIAKCVNGGISPGIGGSNNDRGGSVVINGGKVEAVGGMYAAGIGSSMGKNFGDITINGGTVTATGGASAPGIGVASGGEGGKITINIGITTVTATAGEGSDIMGFSVVAEPIGAGAYGNCESIYIDKYLNDTTDGSTRTIQFTGVNLSTVSESTVTVDNNEIITGVLTDDREIEIADGATVKLKDVTIDGDRTKGLKCLGDATIMLDGKNVIKSRGNDCAGIYVPNGKKLTITGVGELYVSSNSGAGIGGYTGYGGSCGNICIEGGTIVAEGNYGAAGIGSGGAVNCGEIAIVGGDVTAKGANGAAGIGCGASGNCGDIIIGSGVNKVVATGGDSYLGNNDLVLWGPGEPIGPGGHSYNEPSAGYNDSVCGNIVIPIDLTDTPYEETRTRTICREVVDLDLQNTTIKATSGMSLVGKTAHKVTVPNNGSVIINGIEVGGETPEPEFSSEGKAATTDFVAEGDGNWTLTTFAELSNDAVGGDLDISQVKVYSAETLEELENAEPISSDDLEVAQKKSAVMTRIKVRTTPTPDAKSRFFRVDFGNKQQ